jgi:benzoyl-CoA 2,3-dioxygenase component A
VRPAPWSAEKPSVNLYTLAKPAKATVAGNFRLTGDGASSDVRHIVLDFGATQFPVLEGQTIGIVPPGTDAQGRPHYPAPVLDREPARRRAPALQQRRADREARDGGPSRRSGRRGARPITCATSRRATSST